LSSLSRTPSAGLGFGSAAANTVPQKIAIVLAVGRFHLASRHVLAIASIILYAASLGMPAIELRFWRPTVLWGFHAWYFSMFVIPALILQLFNPSIAGDDAYVAFAYVMGDIANLTYIAGFILYFLGVKTVKVIRLCRRVLLLGAILSATVLLPIALTTDLLAIYPGYGLWVASFVALAIAALRMQPNPQLWMPIA
jgi:hypothetical protein